MWYEPENNYAFVLRLEIYSNLMRSELILCQLKFEYKIWILKTNEPLKPHIMVYKANYL